MLENLKPETLAKFAELMRRRQDNRGSAERARSERQRSMMDALPPEPELDADEIATVKAELVLASAALRDSGGFPPPALDGAAAMIIEAGRKRRNET